MLLDLLTQALFECIDAHPAGIDVDQVRQLETTGGGFERRADQGADLPRSLVWLILHRPHEQLDALWVWRHLPCNIGLHDDA
ncbi:hypothetical protein D3C76_656800 [compost metagenome]